MVCVWLERTMSKQCQPLFQISKISGTYHWFWKWKLCHSDSGAQFMTWIRLTIHVYPSHVRFRDQVRVLQLVLPRNTLIFLIAIFSLRKVHSTFFLHSDFAFSTVAQHLYLLSKHDLSPNLTFRVEGKWHQFSSDFMKSNPSPWPCDLMSYSWGYIPPYTPIPSLSAPNTIYVF